MNLSQLNQSQNLVIFSIFFLILIFLIYMMLRKIVKCFRKCKPIKKEEPIQRILILNRSQQEDQIQEEVPNLKDLQDKKKIRFEWYNDDDRFFNNFFIKFNEQQIVADNKPLHYDYPEIFFFKTQQFKFNIVRLLRKRESEKVNY